MGTLIFVVMAAIVLSAVVVCALKGKYVFAILGLVFGIFAIVGAIRLAKPDSWWAQNRYDEEKLQAASARHPRAVPV